MQAVIFDMNGVIINDERIHQESWRVYCKKHGFQITEEDFKHNVFGRTEKDTFTYLYNREITPEELEQFSNERVDTAIEIFKPQIKMTEGLQNLLDELLEMNIPMAIATSARKRYFNFIMDQLNIRKYFIVVLTAEDITKGKPDPEIYLETASKLQIEPQNCIVFEDTLSGIKAAKAAGMKVVGIATTHFKEELGLADTVVNNFEKVNLEFLNSV